MTTQTLIDPTLRRARLVRTAAAILVAAVLITLAVFSRGLQPEARSPPTLPSPRKAAAVSGRRPAFGQRPAAGRTREGRVAPRSLRAEVDRATSVTAPSLPSPRASRGTRAVVPPGQPAEASIDPEVIAFLDPSAHGALASLDRHALALSSVATTGLLLGAGGTVIDRLDPAALDVARSHALPIFALLQNLDENGGGWLPKRVAQVARDRRARARLAAQLAELLVDKGLAGVHLDLEEVDELGDDDRAAWQPVMRIAADVVEAVHARGLAVWIDLPAFVDPGVLARFGAMCDRVVIMAYDEHDQDGPPGPVASEGYVDDALADAQGLPPGRLVAGLGIYGYDWIGSEPADPVSFVQAHTAAKEARIEPAWDRASSTSHFRYTDEEGSHDVWLADAASTWNQLAIARRHGVAGVALWRLGEEDPGVWEALAAHGSASGVERLSSVAADDGVDNQGDGPFLSLALAPGSGERRLTASADGDARIVDEEWRRLPSPYLVRRAGIVPGKVAITFDDGPDPRYTPAILDELHAAGVPAAFFVVGASAAMHASIVRRAFAEGHEIGNHSFTHPDVDSVSDTRLHLELEATSRLVETLIGRRPLLYRPPSLADIEPRTAAGAAAFARAGSLGYLVIDADVDPRDWECPSASTLAARVIEDARDGGVILLHDGGGDRTTTVEALPAILDGLWARGMRVAPLAELVGKQRDQVMPPVPARASLSAAADHAVFGGAATALRWASRCLGLGLVLVTLRTLLVIVGALVSERARRRRRRACATVPEGMLPSTMVLIPAYNEAAVIDRTLDSVLASDLPVEVVVVDDGSTDETAGLVEERAGRDARVRLIRQRNGGKAAALRNGFAATHADVIVALDGDTLFAPDTVRRLVEPLRDPRVGAVAGTAEVGNQENALTRCQTLEYLLQQEVERRAWDALGALPVVPGAVGAWRRQAVIDAGGFSSDTLAEDADLAMALCRAGWKIVHAPEARARTEAPSTARTLIRQRVRWSFGVLQAMWKHRAALTCARSGAFGRAVLPAMILFQVVLPLLTPAAIAGAVAAAVSGNWRPALVAAGLLLAAEVVQAALAFVLARRSGGRATGWLWPWLFVGRFFYRPLLLAVTARSLGRVLDGIPLGWNKLARRGTVAP